ncbi:MAG: Trk system potassium transporter TrkA [Paludibacteraceae bacterium]|nr:Trk system potassium transporter TrkA [Paludibacteraceae bacterium]
MRIIIAGAGEVGTHLAKLLSREEMEISLLDESPEKLGDLSATYDILTKVGSPTSIRDLKDLRTKDCDLFISVTPHETENMTACLIANSLGAKRTLARIDNYEYLLPENKKFFEQMGLNHLIYPEVLAANNIVESLRTNWMRYHFTLCDGKLELCVVKVRAGAPVIGQTFRSGYYAHCNYRIVAIKRLNETIIPDGNDYVMEGDMVYVICTKDQIHFMREQLGKPQREIKNITFFGGGRVTYKACLSLPEEREIKIIEPDMKQCEYISEKLPNALVIHAEASDVETLLAEGLQESDAVVAAMDSSESNIFACLTAKRFGVRKTIAEIESIDYIPMAEGLDIGSVLNKKTITASYIYQMLLGANVRNLANADAEIVEFHAKEDSAITKDMIKNLSLPDDANIGGIVRAGEGLLVNGDTQILPGDQVVVFCKSHALRKLEKMFK